MRLYCFKSRSFRLPNIFLRRPVTMTFARKFKPQSLAPRRTSANAREALNCIEKNTPLGEVLQKAEKNLVLQQGLSLCLSQNGLAQASTWVTVSSFSEPTGELKLLVANSALAHRLQQKLPSILLNLQKQGWAVQFITLKQAPGGIGIQASQVTPIDSNPPIFGPKAEKSWSGLLEKLETGSPLRAAVEKLLKNRKK